MKKYKQTKYLISVVEKNCIRCHKILEANKFYRQPRSRDGLSKICRLCTAETRETPEKQLCPECQKTKPAAEFNYHHDKTSGLVGVCKECLRSRNYQKRYGITIAEYNLMLEWQDGMCLICGIYHEDAVKGKLVIDHDHSTNMVRGLLCNDCNWMLGHARDNLEVLEHAIGYLKEYNKGEVK